MIYRLVLIFMALGFAPGAFATECRTTHDGIGAGLSWTECDDGAKWETQRDGIGAGTEHTEIREPAERPDHR